MATHRSPAAEVVVVALQQQKLHHWRNQNGPAQADAIVLLKLAAKLRHPKAAVALPSNEYRRQPAVVGRQIALNKLAQGVEVAIDRPEFFGLFVGFVRPFVGGLIVRFLSFVAVLGQNPAKARAHGVNKD